MWQKCPICNGNGFVEVGKTCPTCKGERIINKLTGKPPVKKKVLEDLVIKTKPLSNKYFL